MSKKQNQKVHKIENFAESKRLRDLIKDFCFKQQKAKTKIKIESSAIFGVLTSFVCFG